jgi:hypothetical protein
MIALSHASSRVLPNRCSAWYTPGLHGRPSTILIGARDSETPVGGRASTSKLSSLAVVPSQCSFQLFWSVLDQGVTFCTPFNTLLWH